jgi:integrase
MGVNLREKKLKSGGISYYLDIMHGGKRWYEFLGIQVHGAKRAPENLEKKRMADQARIIRENQLIVEKNGLENTEKREKCMYEFIIEKSVHKQSKLHFYLIKVMKAFSGMEILPISSIDENFLREFQAYLKQRFSKSTPFYMIYYLSSYLNLAVEYKYRRDNPYRYLPKAEKIRRVKSIPKSLTLDEIMTLANDNNCNSEDVKLMFLLACFTGLRYSDISRLRFNQFNEQRLADRTITVLRFTMKKTSSDAYIPLSSQAQAILEMCKERNVERERFSGKPCPYLFPDHANEATHTNKQSSTHSYLQRWGRKAGIKTKLHFHLARHSFATITLELGADLYTVSKLLGHANIATTTVYAHVGDKLKMQAIESLSRMGGFPRIPNQNSGAA